MTKKDPPRPPPPLGEAIVLDDERTIFNYPTPADIPIEERQKDPNILKYFVRMADRYGAKELYSRNDLVGVVNRRFRDLSNMVIAYLQDTIFTYHEGNEILMEAGYLEMDAGQIERIIDEIAEYGTHEDWVANDVELLQNTLENYNYFQGELRRSGVLDY